MAWSDGIAEWEEGGVTYLSVVFTYKLNEAYDRAQRARLFSREVRVGGPAVFLMAEGKLHHPIGLISKVGGSYPDAVAKHNALATFASRGCPVGGKKLPKALRDEAHRNEADQARYSSEQREIWATVRRALTALIGDEPQPGKEQKQE